MSIKEVKQMEHHSLKDGARNARLGYILKKPFVYAVEDEYFIRPIIYDLREF
jgi:hypothetical protein